MTAWVPLFTSSKTVAGEFTGLAPATAKPDFRALELSNPEDAGALSHIPCRSLEPESTALQNQLIEANRRIADLETNESLLTMQLDQLRADMTHMATEHEAALKAASGPLAAELLRQHGTAIGDLKNIVAQCTADVLRPILSSAATEAAVRDFKQIINELVDDPNGAGFSIRTSDNFLQRLGEALPQQAKIIRCDTGETEISFTSSKEVIASRLAEWAQSIAGHDRDE